MVLGRDWSWIYTLYYDILLESFKYIVIDVFYVYFLLIITQMIFTDHEEIS